MFYLTNKDVPSLYKQQYARGELSRQEFIAKAEKALLYLEEEDQVYARECERSQRIDFEMSRGV